MNIATPDFIERKTQVSAPIRKPYASEVANDIVNNVRTAYDFSDWASFDDDKQAQCFRELVAEVADSAHIEVGARVKEYLEAVFKVYAIKEGYPE
ncbi:MAG: hypothetical protein CTY33_00185 [Methylotenera sp.]|nr:MAG: hypothetical protein CTY33_00185 [Methylotenera sp.]